MKVTVKPALLKWARERSGLTAEVLEERFPKFSLWEQEEDMPTLRQLEELAKKTFTPLGYFFLPEPPEDKLPIPDFRTVRNAPVQRPSPNLLETVQVMQRRQAWMREFLIEQKTAPLSFVNSARLRDNPNSVAAKIKGVLNMTNNWAQGQATWTDALRAMRIAIEEVGILVVINGVVGNNVYRKLDTKEFRGFVLCDEYAPLIFVNGADAKAAQMFTLAHELAHLWIGKDGVFNLHDLQPVDNDVEKFCNQVAAEFLVPQQEMTNCWPNVRRDNEPFQSLARRFKVSPIVAARRALDLGLIRRRAFLDFYRDYQEDERRRIANRTSGGDFYANQDVRIGKRFANAVVRAAKEGRLLYRDAYQLTGLSGETFDKYAKSLGFRF
jgi:Zn-dependent peptidase ImmA (M78 family)